MSNHLPPPVTYAEFKERVRCLCALFDASETSGGRSEKRNEAVGGDPNSRHLTRRGAMGTDVVPDENTQEVRDQLVESAHRLGLSCLDEGDHVHLQAGRPA